MKLILNYLLLSSVILFFTQDAEAKRKKQYFNQTQIDIELDITHPIFSGNFIEGENNEILVIGIDDQKQKKLVVYGSVKKPEVITEEPSATKDEPSATKDEPSATEYEPSANTAGPSVPTKIAEFNIPSSAVAFDLLTSADGIEKVLLLDTRGLSQLNLTNNIIVRLPESQSIYLNKSPQFVAKKKLVQDLNGDGLDDIFVTSFEGVTLFLQNKTGEFDRVKLPIEPVVDMTSERISFSETRLFNIDTNFDQLIDIVVLEQGVLQIYQQTEKGLFSPLKNLLTLPMQVSALPWWTLRGADGESADQSNLQHRMLETIEDINGDNIPDIMIRQTKSSGVLDRQNHYEIFYGKNKEGLLNFDSKANTKISAEGTLSGLQLIDIDADGRKEILVSSFDIGVSQIIGALLSGSIDQDVFVFVLDSNDQYIEDPLFSEEVDLNFSLSSGSTGQPIVLSADLNGDGIKEIMLSANDRRLAIYRGEKSKKMFRSRAKRHRMSLPQNGSMVSAVDLNNDDRQEIIVHYGKQDEQALRRRVVILSAK